MNSMPRSSEPVEQLSPFFLTLVGTTNGTSSLGYLPFLTAIMPDLFLPLDSIFFVCLSVCLFAVERPVFNIQHGGIVPWFSMRAYRSLNAKPCT